MDNDRFVALLQADGERLAEVAARDFDAQVPPCPGWTVRDAVRHTGEVYTHKLACMSLGRRPEKGEWSLGPDADEDLLDWFRGSLRQVVDEIQARGPDAPTYTWHQPDQTVGFWYRRMAQETAVHRFDVESAFGEVTPVDDELAVDGIDEVLTIFVNAAWTGKPPPRLIGKSVEVRTGDHAWLLTFRADGVDVTPGLGPHDALVSGEPSELLLYLWGRRPLSAVMPEGDKQVLADFREFMVSATQ
jgi:uncharacterized protein (TIGR03083 family)